MTWTPPVLSLNELDEDQMGEYYAAVETMINNVAEKTGE